MVGVAKNQTSISKNEGTAALGSFSAQPPYLEGSLSYGPEIFL